MNVPLFWLSDFVTLPESRSELTDRLTMIGHMLDKTLDVNGEVVIDLELRGNRSDLFGLIGIARDISAAWNVPLQLPKTAKLHPHDPTSKIITVEATDVVPRFSGLTLSVQVGPSPDWLVRKLTAYGMASINNVVDITNYVMIETGIPLHAFDKHKLKGERLIVRNALKHEKMVTFMGETITLSPEDITLSDEHGPQAITLVGSRSSGTTNETKEILLEGAVYNQASVRRTSRRLGVRTEAGTRLEKHLDPNDIPFALARAVYLLEQCANAKITSGLSDHYENKKQPITIDLVPSEVFRLSGIDVPVEDQKIILERLGCSVKEQKKVLIVTVPTFRTDIHESADLVEEITRITGYETVPTLTLSGELPPEQTSDRVKQEDEYKKILVQLQTNEVITSSFFENTTIDTYSVNGTFPEVVRLTNAPDPAIATLRPTLVPNLVDYARRLLNERAERVSLFEIGKVYWKTVQHKKSSYTEERRLSIILTGTTDTKSYGKQPRELTFYDLKGIVEILFESLGIHIQIKPIHKVSHPSLDTHQQAEVFGVLINGSTTSIGFIGKLDQTIQTVKGISANIFVAEFSLDALNSIQRQGIKPYKMSPQYPPVIEDISFIVNEDTHAGEIIEYISTMNPLIAEVSLLDAYEEKRTIRITYQDPKKNLSGEEVRPLREKIIEQVTKKFNVNLLA